MHLASDRLIIRNFEKSDGQDLFEYLSDEDVVRYEPYEPCSLKEACSEAASRADDESFAAVCLKDSRKLIGNLYFNKIDPDFINTFEIGYVFNKNYHGKGYATEACVCLLEYIFARFGAHRVIAFCNPDNEPSWRLLERLGFRREGEQKKNMYFRKDPVGNPIWFDSYQYALLSVEFLENTD